MRTYRSLSLTLCIISSLSHAAPSPADLGLDKSTATGNLSVMDRSGTFDPLASVNSTAHTVTILNASLVAIPNSSLANTGTTVGGSSCVLGASCSPSTTVGGTACGLGSSCAPSVTVNGTTCTLGSSCTPSSTASLTIGTSPTSGGAAGQLMFDTGSVLTESATLVYTNPILKIVSNTGALALGTASDTILVREGAGILSQRNTTNKQTFAVYDSFTDATHYERGVLDWNQTANVLSIGTQMGSGSGSTLGQFQFIANGVAKGDYGVSTAGSWTFAAPLLSNSQISTTNQISATGNITGLAAIAASGQLSGGTIVSGSTIESTTTMAADAGNITAKAGSLVATGALATVTTGQVAYSGTVVGTTSSCGSLSGGAGCVEINVAGTTRFVPFY